MQVGSDHWGVHLFKEASVSASSGTVRPAKVLVLVVALVLVGSACAKGRTTTSGAALTTVFVQKFRYHGMPSTVTSGLHQFLFQNKESFPITHEMIPVAVPAGKTAQDVIADAKSKGPDSEDDWLHIGGDFGPADTGAGVVETLFLPPGTYAIACWQTGTPEGKEDGPTHASIGMVFTFTVTP
jgi:hypothetical protein